MGIPLNKLLKVGGLRHCQVVAGHSGLENMVNNVTVMEVPDIVTWLKGNELLLTSLYPIKDDVEKQVELLDKLQEVHTVALAIKPARFVDAIPEEMKTKADEYGIVLLEIPEQISYLDILSPAMNAIFNQKVVLQEDLEYATRLLDEISIANGGFDRFIETLSYLAKSKVFLESYVPYIHLSEQKESLETLNVEQLRELEAVQRPIRMMRKDARGDLVSCIVAPILVEGDLYGSVTCWDYQSGFMEVDLAIQEKAASLLSLQFLRKKIKYDVEQNYKSEFIRDLLFNQEMNRKDLVERAETYGFRRNERYLCILANKKEGLSEDVFKERISQIEVKTNQLEKGAITAAIRNSILFIIPEKNRSIQGIKKVAEKLLMEIEKVTHTRVRIGIGPAYLGINGLRRSFSEAEKAISLGTELWEDKAIVHYDSLGVYRLISLVDDHQELENYYDESMKKLIVYSRENDLNLLRTLEMYFKCNESLKETASQLYIHVNTLKYRLQKIKQITGLNLNLSEDKLMLLMGLKIYHYFSVIIDKDKR
ncbi:PucR family transcriptional regulator [Oceanobacillus halophilus]|uniref:PucR family transcriptional regulator n=1 Tax=Oceanobacillus halophilus TaxID=930130 RepID=A0A494ZUG6_9BACI|nr:PucR family transcriptional regulator [Oceanobacillus halophilus]RKQ29283.1 PucR family transcriptional regulator [Oceanobacillus halophilus]